MKRDEGAVVFVGASRGRAWVKRGRERERRRVLGMSIMLFCLDFFLVDLLWVD